MQRGKEGKLYKVFFFLKSCSVHFILRFLEENLGNTVTTYTKLEGYTTPGSSTQAASEPSPLISATD